MENRLWYRQPARNWNEALPIGNGQLGAMVFGGPSLERLALNHDTLWSGAPERKATSDLRAEFVRARDLALSGQYPQAQEVLERRLCGSFHEGYLPLGDMCIALDGSAPAGEYRRELCLDTARASVAYATADGAFGREMFVSAPDNALVVRLTAREPGGLSFCAALSSPLRYTLAAQNDLLLLKGQCPSHVEPIYVSSPQPVCYDPARQGVCFCGGLRAQTDGRQSVTAQGLRVVGATWATLVFAVETSFVDFQTPPEDPEWRCEARCGSRLLEMNMAYEPLLERHIADYQALERACAFSLPAAPQRQTLPTDQRLAAFDLCKDDMGLMELLFCYGRYLLISSSRRGTQPATLQGIWNDQVRAPWSSNYTLNINTEMNYWPALTTNLFSCAEPLVRLVRELAIRGAGDARTLYGAQGYVAHHNADLWRNATPVGAHQPGSACYGFWPMSGPWLCRTVYELYEHTGDEVYLRETAFPLLRGAAEFLLDMLREDEQGELILCPATSPENNFLLDGKQVAVSKSAAMSQAIARELFANCHRACMALGGQDALAARLQEALHRLKPLAVGDDGRVLEWHEPQREAEPHHRHLSHLYALYPGQQISPLGEPALTEACRRSLEGRGDEATGWSLAWKVNLWARLWDGDRALKLLKMQLRAVDSDVTDSFAGGGSYPNLLCAHPPFQIDGNLGAVAGIMEMLMQSTAEELRLLPALPRAWPEGRLTGGRAKGGLTVDLAWYGDGRREAALTASREVRLTLCMGAGTEAVHLDAHERRLWTWSENE